MKLVHPMQRVDVTLLVPDHTVAAHKTYLSIGFLLLDQSLGEYDVMTRVGRVEVRAPTAADQATVSSGKLAASFDAHFLSR